MSKKCIFSDAGYVRASQKRSKNSLQKNIFRNRNVTTQQTLHHELHTHYTLVRGCTFHIQAEFLKNLILPRSYNVYNGGYFTKIFSKMLVFDRFVKNTFCESCNFFLKPSFCMKLVVMKRTRRTQHKYFKILFIASFGYLVRAENLK